MDKSKFNQMIHAQDTAHMNAYHFLTSSWHTPTWTTIPQGIKNTLGLPACLGMYNGQLCTRESAAGAQEFINRLNNRKVN